MIAAHLAKPVAISCLLAACSSTAPDDPGDPAAGGGPSAVAAARAPEAGRYWAHVFGHGVTSIPVALWFEYKPDSVPSWVFVPKTPEQTIAAGTDLATVDAWLDGLTAGTGYSVRQCARDAAGGVLCDATPAPFATRAAAALPWIAVDAAHPRQLIGSDGKRWVPWGNNYVGVGGSPVNHHMVEDNMYDAAGLARIDADLARVALLDPPDGTTNVVRMHVQLARFLRDPTTPDHQALARFAHVIELAEDHGLHVLVTGLNDFYPGDNPAWVGQQTDEATHWATQATWWSYMALALHDSPGVFAYDLMNEPYVGGNVIHDDGVWWTNVAPTGFCSYGENQTTGDHGTCFGQFVTPNPGTRTAAVVAADWTQRMVHAIRFIGPFANDQRHLVTIGVGAFGMSNVFHSASGVRDQLDFLEPHLYPDGNAGQDAIDLAAALAAVSTKPIIAGETFSNGPERHLIATACNAGTVGGWIGQFDDRRLGDACPATENALVCAFYDAWYVIARDFGPMIRHGECPAPQ